MATRVVEWKKPYTWGKAISIDENKVISLNLRDENNLIIYDAGDDEIYVDLQLDDEITPTSAFPIWVNVGRVIVDNWWDKPWTIISAETTSGDNIKIFYADEWTLWIDNWTGTFKQIYFKADVDALLLALRNYIDWELAKKQNWVSSDTAPSNPNEWDLWYDTTNSTMKVWNWTVRQSVGTWWWAEIEYVTQAEYNALPSSKLTDWKHYLIYTSDSPTPTPYPTNWLIGYYSFENDSDNDTVLHDDSWLGNNWVRDSSYGSIVTGWKVWTNCLYKNTNNKTPWKVDRTSTFTYTTAVSIMGWCKSVSASNYIWLWGFFDWTWDYTNQRSVAIRWVNEYASLVVWNSTWRDWIEANDLIWDGWVWTHYAVTWGWANNTVKVYRNWTEIYSNDLWYFFSWISPFYFASVDWWWAGAGYIDDVLIYNRVLTAQEISDYYTATA